MITIVLNTLEIIQLQNFSMKSYSLKVHNSAVSPVQAKEVKIRSIWLIPPIYSVTFFFFQQYWWWWKVWWDKFKIKWSSHVFWIYREKYQFILAAAAKSLQSCFSPTLCDPIDGSPLDSSVPGILQERILEWVAISFSNACMHAKLIQSCPILCDPMNNSPPGPSIHGILQARILEWVAISISKFIPTVI